MLRCFRKEWYLCMLLRQAVSQRALKHTLLLLHLQIVPSQAGLRLSGEPTTPAETQSTCSAVSGAQLKNWLPSA